MKAHGRSRLLKSLHWGVLLTFLLSLSLPAFAEIWTYSCNDDPLNQKSIFDKSEFICAAGTGVGGGYVAQGCGFTPCADIYIMSNRTWSGGEALADALGSENRVETELMGGGFGIGSQVIIATPSKSKVGEYDIILDNNLDQKYSGNDEVAGAGSNYAFRIEDRGHPPVDATAIKNAAKAMSEGASDAIAKWKAGCDLLDVMGSALSLMSGDVVGAAIGVLGNITGIATDYNGAVISKATDLIGGFDPKSNPQKASGIYGNIAKHWYDLYEDPADANFTVLVPLDFAAINAELAASSVADSYPFQTKGTDPREAVLIRIANRAVEQGALVKALRQSFEKYQGAAAVANYEYAYRQAEQTKKYGELLKANLLAFKNDLADLKGALASAGVADHLIKAADIKSIKDRVTASGLTDDEIKSLKEAGFSDARITLLTQYIKAISVPSADFTMSSSIASLTATIDTATSSIETFNGNLQTAMNNLAPEFTPQAPTANAGGPYSGVTGNQIVLDGSGSTDPNTGDTLSYAWDLNGDGVFDDGTGRTVTHSWSKPFSGLIGLKVTDTAGNNSIAYAKVTIAPANLPPSITSFLPTSKNLRASVSTPITFTAAASDPENDPLTYQWTLDGVAVGTGTSYTLQPQPYVKGTSQVMVTVRDNHADNPSAIEARAVNLYLDCDPSDPATMTTYYRDADGDGFGDVGNSTLACSQPAGYVTNHADCNDGNAAVGQASQLFYRDGDGDGLGDPSLSVKACAAPAGYVDNNLDCNDSDANVGKASLTFYRDADGDGFGNPALSVLACAQPAGYVADNHDCNDNDAPVGNQQQTYYRDADGDGYGDPGNSVVACTAPAGYVTNALDCDDSNPYVNPGMREIMYNGKDDDCNAATLDNWSKSFILGIDDSSWIYYAKSNGDGTFSNYRTIDNLDSGSSRGIAMEDFNGDGYLDFVAGRGDGSIFLFLNDGQDNFIEKGVVATHPNIGWMMDMAAGDFNNDGLPDFVANGDNRVTAIFLNDGKGGFTRTGTINLPYTGRGNDVADFDGDGNLDFAVAFYGSNDVWVYRGDGKGNFTGAKVGTASTANSDNYAVAAADFDNDGVTDIIVAGSNNGDSFFLKGNGDGTFKPAVYVGSLDPDNYHSAIDAYDFNNDGNIDIVMGNYGSNNRLWFFPGKGDGTFGTRTAISPNGTRANLLASSAPPTLNRVPGAPVADPEPRKQTLSVGGTATFDGSFSFAPGGAIASYDWRYGDGTSGSGAAANHVFTSEGRFLPALTVTDDKGKRSTAAAEVIVQGNPPVANAGGPYVVGEASASNGRYTVTLDGSGSTDDYGIAEYQWETEDPLYDDFEDGNAGGWSPTAGTWSVSNGVYLQSNASPDRTDTFTGSATSGDYTVEADVMITGGEGQEAQLLFRGVDANNHYEFILRGRGINDVLLYRQQNGGFSELGRYLLPFAPQLNTWYHLKAEAYGSRIKLYLNDSLLIDYRNATDFYNGKVGFSTYRSSAKFDNLKVVSKASGPKPTRVYLEGSYNVKLTVTDKAGQKSTATATLNTIKGNPPVANPGGPYVQDETKASANNWTIYFNGSGSTDDTGIESYYWTFGDGGTGSGANPGHTYTGASTRTVTLTVTDRSGQSSTKTTTVTTKGNDYPVARPGGPYNVTEDQVLNKHWTINVDAKDSSDDVGIWKYYWDFGDGSTADTKAASHTYATPGTYTVTLTVTDHANQSHSATTTASVTTTGAPTASAGGPYLAEPNTPVAFDGSGSTDNVGIYSYSWDFGDGSTGKGQSPTHSYAANGTYNVTLTVKDASLKSATATTTVTVAPGNPPVADAGAPYTGSVGVPVRLNGSGSTDDFGIASYKWKVGSTNLLLDDGFTGTTIDASKWLFPSAGVTQNGAITIADGGWWWGSRYLFSKGDLPVDGTTVMTAQVKQTAGGYMMIGFKNTNTNYSYGEMPYALYFCNGSFQIYEKGGNQSNPGSYSFNTLYDVKIELKGGADGAVSGARYYYKPATEAAWTLAYDSNTAAPSTMKAGASYYGGTYVIDNFTVVSGVMEATGEKPAVIPRAAGTYPVEVTVTDGAGQSSTATSTLTVSGDPLVITAPWQFTGGVEVPHDTWSGADVILKAVAKAGRSPLTYTWDFGDGTNTSGTVTNPYDISVHHTYTAADGTPITARVTVTDADGKSSTRTYPIMIRAKSLNVEVNKAIDDALWALHTNQQRPAASNNGYWSTSGQYGWYYSSPTASAVHAMEINGHLEVGDFSKDPYVEDVWRGLQYVFSTLRAPAISEQAYGDPDLNSNGIGVQVNSDRPVYEGGQIMMALVASGTPNMKATGGPTGIYNRSYRDIVEDMAEMYYWGQGDDSWGYGGGGWRYDWQGQGDNSACQWAALGLTAAEEQSWIKVPQWVKDRNLVWLAYSYDGTGYGYTGPGNGDATTPSGLAQLAFDNVPTTDSRWKKTENFLASYWNYWYNGTGNYYALYAMAKALRTAKPKEVIVMGEGTTNAIDWYNDPTRGVARTIVNQRDANGNLTGGGGTQYVVGPYKTAWGVIILTKTLFVLPPVAVAGENRVWGVNWDLTFDGSKSYHLDPFRKIVKYEWDFDGDGVYDYAGSQPTATHTYTELGTYKATLRVTDNNDPPKYATDTVNIVVAIPPHPPIAEPGGPYVGYAGIPLQLDGGRSYDIDPTDFITSYGWELDGAYPYNFADATGATPTFTWSSPGTYNIGLKVYDNGVLNPPNYDKLSDIRWTTVTIKPNNAPMANAGGPYSAREGDLIRLDGGASYDPDGNPISYAWDLDNDGTFETTGAKPNFTRPDNGTFTVRLKVSDGALDSVATATVTVDNVAPVVTPLPAANLSEGGSYAAAGSFNDPGADTWTATVDYGDGSGAQPLPLAGKTFALNHLYPQSGTYTVTVTVTDKDGGAGSTSTAVTVGNIAPIVDAGPNVTLTNTRSFSSAGSFIDPGADTWTARVNYGDGTGDQPLQLNPDKTFALNHLYTGNGSFTVKVTVTDSDGAIGSRTAQVLIPNKPPVVNAGSGGRITEGSSFSGSGSFSDSDSTGWTATVDYGDGSGIQPLALNPDKTFGLSHTYTQDGTYTVTVAVTDDEGAKGTGTAVIQVDNAPPSVNAGADATIKEKDTFTSTGSFSDPGADRWTATVNYGDGSGDQPLLLNADRSFNLSHVYATQGSYTVTVAVRDEAGGAGSDSAVVTVKPLAVQTIKDLVARPKSGKADLVWTCVPGNVTYNIYRGTKAGGPYARIATGHTSTYCTYADSGLTNGTTYYWRVTSVDSQGESLYSNEASARPMSR